MKFKKLISLTLCTTLLSTFMVGCSKKEDTTSKDDKEKQYSVSMISDVAGINDHSFNQSAWEGLQRAEKDLNVKVKYLESKQDADYTTNVETLVDEGTDLIIGVGAKLAPIIEQAAKDYPDQKFIIVDETYEDIPKNVETIILMLNNQLF